MALATEEGRKQSNRLIADHVGVSHHLVNELRRQLELDSSSNGTETRTGLDGKTRKVPSKKPDKPKTDEQPEEPPEPFGVEEGCTEEEAAILTEAGLPTTATALFRDEYTAGLGCIHTDTSRATKNAPGGISTARGTIERRTLPSW